MSPVGIPRQPTEDQKMAKESTKPIGNLFEQIGSVAKEKFWANNFSPVSLLRAGGTLGANKILTDYVN